MQSRGCYCDVSMRLAHSTQWMCGGSSNVLSKQCAGGHRCLHHTSTLCCLHAVSISNNNGGPAFAWWSSCCRLAIRKRTAAQSESAMKFESMYPHLSFAAHSDCAGCAFADGRPCNCWPRITHCAAAEVLDAWGQGCVLSGARSAIRCHGLLISVPVQAHASLLHL